MASYGTLAEALRRIIFIVVASSACLCSENCEDAEEHPSLSLLQVSLSLRNATAVGSLATEENATVSALVGIPRVPTVAPMLNHVPGDTDLYTLSERNTNIAAVSIVVILLVGTAIGHFCSAAESHCPAWVVAMLIISYVVWVLGFFMVNTSMLLAVRTQSGKGIIITHPFGRSHKHEPGKFSESPYIIISTLLQAQKPLGKLAGAIFVVLAVGDPILKLALMIAGEVMRRKEETVECARRCLIAVQVLSKWASPIFFYMIMLQCQFLSLNTGTDVEAKACLDIGWVGYSIFCVTNLVSALSIKLPSQESEGYRGTAWAFQLLGNSGAAYAVGIAGLFNLAFLSVGIFTPSFSYGNVHESLQHGLTQPAFHALKDTRVDVWQCFSMLLSRSISTQQVIPFLAAVMFFIFVMLLPVIDMSALVLTCFFAHSADLESARKTIAVSRFTRHCLMSDVTVVAFLLTAMAGMLHLHSGVKALFIAEAIRYTVTYSIVEGGISEQLEAKTKLMFAYDKHCTDAS